MSVFDIEVVRLAEATDVETYVAAFETAAVLGAHRATVNIDDPDRSRTVDRFGRLCDLAAPHGLSLDIEFMIWRPVARLEDAVSIVTAAARRNGHVLVDALHLDRSGGTPAAVAAVDAALIGCVRARAMHRRRDRSLPGSSMRHDPDASHRGRANCLSVPCWTRCLRQFPSRSRSRWRAACRTRRRSNEPATATLAKTSFAHAYCPEPALVRPADTEAPFLLRRVRVSSTSSKTDIGARVRRSRKRRTPCSS